MQLQIVDIFINPIASNLQIGIYHNELIEKFELQGKTSDILADIFKKILDKYNVKNIFYVNGVGSYMSLKITYIFIKTLSITKDINIYGAEGFYFNQNSPIKAIGKKYFIKKGDEIVLDFYNGEIKDFEIPEKIDKNIFIKDAKPNYFLGVV